MRTLIYGLGSNQTLTDLDLLPEMSIEHFRSMCSALKENRQLENLRISLKLGTEGTSQIAAIELANLLKANRSLVTVWNYWHDVSVAPNRVGTQLLLEAFHKNCIVKEIKLYREDPDESWIFMEKDEDHILGIQPRQRHVVFNHRDEQSGVDDAFSDCESSSRDGDWMVDTKMCDMMNSIPDVCSDCMIPDVGDVLRDLLGAPASKENNVGSSVQ
jgi:hypothetical protein